MCVCSKHHDRTEPHPQIIQINPSRGVGASASEVDLRIVHAQEIVFFISIYIHKSTDTRWFVTFHVILRRGRSKYIPSWTVSAHSGVQPVKKKAEHDRATFEEEFSDLNK